MDILDMIGQVAAGILGEPVRIARIRLCGSFARAVKAFRRKILFL